MDWLKKLRENEPLRLILYPLIIALGGLFIGLGWVDPDVWEVILAVVAAVFGVEVARTQVTPNSHAV